MRSRPTGCFTITSASTAVAIPMAWRCRHSPESRIIHVADAFEAMTSDRPYRVAPGEQFAVESCEGTSTPSSTPASLRRSYVYSTIARKASRSSSSSRRLDPLLESHLAMLMCTLSPAPAVSQEIGIRRRMRSRPSRPRRAP